MPSSRSRPHLRAIGGGVARREQAAEAVDSWEGLYREHHEAIFRHASYLMGDPVAAEDLSQEAFATAFSSMDEFDGRSSFLSWVRGIALNLARMHWRRRSTTQRVHASISRQHHAAPASHRDAPDVAHEQQRRMEALYGVLERLPEHLREVFILRDLEALSGSEVAALLDITPNNVRVRANRARAKIRDHLCAQGLLPEDNA